MNKNLAPKIISILFALVLWMYVMDTNNPGDFRNFPNIPVTLINVEELKGQKLAIKGDNIFSAKVKITGRRDEINQITAEQIRVRADLKGYGPGINSIPLEVIAPSNVEVSVTPRFINIELEDIIKEEKRIKIVTAGKPSENFVIGRIKYEPTTVEVEGPESYIKLIENIIGRIDISNKSRNFELNVPLEAINSKGEKVENIDIKTPQIDVSLSVDLLKTVPIRHNLQVTTEDGYIVTGININPREIVLKGQEDILSDISEVNTELIKIDNLNTNRSIDAALDLPEGIDMYEDLPINISLSLEKIEEKIYKINKDKITFNNLDEKLEVDTSNIPESIDLKVVALKNVLDSIVEDDIKIMIDLKNLSEDEYTIEPAVQLPYNVEKEVKESDLNPKTISIKRKTRQ